MNISFPIIICWSIYRLILQLDGNLMLLSIENFFILFMAFFNSRIYLWFFRVVLFHLLLHQKEIFSCTILKTTHIQNWGVGRAMLLLNDLGLILLCLFWLLLVLGNEMISGCWIIVTSSSAPFHMTCFSNLSFCVFYKHVIIRCRVHLYSQR